MKNLFIKRLSIILGFILILLSIAIGISIIIFSFKYMAGSWLTFGKYIISTIALGIAAFFIAFIGIIIVYVSIVDDINSEEK